MKKNLEKKKAYFKLFLLQNRPGQIWGEVCFLSI